MSSNDQDLGIGTASSEGEYYSQLLVNIPWAIPLLGYGVPTIFLFFIKASSTLLKSKTFVYVFPYFLILLVGENNYLILISVQFYIVILNKTETLFILKLSYSKKYLSQPKLQHF